MSLAISSRIMEDIHRMEKTLNQASADGDAEVMLNCLRYLSTVAISAQLLRSSTIARSVGRLRKHTHSGVATASSDIIKRWKAFFRDDHQPSPRASSSHQSPQAASRAASSAQQSPRTSSTSSTHQKWSGAIIPESAKTVKVTAKLANVAKATGADDKGANSTSANVTRGSRSLSTTLAGVRSPSSNVTITFTFGDRAENGPGMQHVLGPRGALTKGLELEELRGAHTACLAENLAPRIVDLRALLPTADAAKAEPAYLFLCPGWAARPQGSLVANGEAAADGTTLGAVGRLSKRKSLADALFEEHSGLDWDTKAKMRGQVKNKTARHNLCYAGFDQEPDYDNGRGRVYSWPRVPALAEARNLLPSYFGDIVEELPAEGNKYYRRAEGGQGTGIGFHGDAERVVVVALRVGAPRVLQYQWYRESEPVGARGSVELAHGDLYAMSHKATGNDWRRTRNGLLTLRHAAGDPKFLRLNEIARGADGIVKLDTLPDAA